MYGILTTKLCVGNGNFSRPFMSNSREFNIREGAKEEVVIDLSQGSIIKWDCFVSDGYDIELSVRVRSSQQTNQGTWVIFEPERITELAGTIDAAEVADDGIPLPSSIEFRLDNSYSWFNPKQVRLTITTASVVVPTEQQKAEIVTVDSPQRTPSPRSDRSVSPRRRDVRVRADLLWINQVVGEALVRCPASAPELRSKLSEVKELLQPRLGHVSSDSAVI